MLFCLCACGSGALPSTEAARPAETAASEISAPADPVAQADALIAAGETEENLNAALKLYQAALDSDPENLDAILGTAEVMIRKGSFDNALKWYLKAAELGNADAMFGIGLLYEYGHGVDQDDEKAMEWYLKAAELGNETAIYAIGDLYEYGNGVDQDIVKASEWKQKANDAN